MQTLLHGYAKDAAQQGILLLQRGAGAIDQGQLGIEFFGGGDLVGHRDGELFFQRSLGCWLDREEQRDSAAPCHTGRTNAVLTPYLSVFSRHFPVFSRHIVSAHGAVGVGSLRPENGKVPSKIRFLPNLNRCLFPPFPNQPTNEPSSPQTINNLKNQPCNNHHPNDTTSASQHPPRPRPTSTATCNHR